MLTKRSVLYAKVEGTYGVDPSPISTDSVLVEDLTWSNEGLRMIDRPAVKTSLSNIQQVYGGRLLQVTFNAEIKGSGSEGVAPELAPVLRACALQENVVADTSVTYRPVSNPVSHDSCTLYIYHDGKLFIVSGCRGNADITLEAGNRGMIAFTLVGHPGTRSDTTLPAGSVITEAPPPYIGGSFTVDGYSSTISSLSLSLGNTVATPPSANGNLGYGDVTITNRDVNGSFDPEDETITTEDYWGNFIVGTSMIMTTGLVGATAGNRYTLYMPSVYYRDVSPGDRDGVRTLDIPFGATEGSGDDEFSLIFT